MDGRTLCVIDGGRGIVSLQDVARDWISLGTTKTGIVYRLKGNPPQSLGRHRSAIRFLPMPS
jgi:hypothetical protein